MSRGNQLSCQEPSLHSVLRPYFGKHQPAHDCCLLSPVNFRDTCSESLKSSHSEDVCGREQTCPHTAVRQDGRHHTGDPKEGAFSHAEADKQQGNGFTGFQSRFSISK